MRKQKIFTLNIDNSITEFNNLTQAKSSNPIAIILEEEGSTYKTHRGNEYLTYNYQFYNEDDSDYFRFGKWTIHNSNQAIYTVDEYIDGWSNLKFSTSGQIWGIQNKFPIADPNGIIENIWFSGLNNLFEHMHFYSGFNSWNEVKMKIENEILRKQLNDHKKAEHDSQ